MKGLLLKDMVNLRAQAKVLLSILVIWVALGVIFDSGEFFSGIMVMFAVMIPFTCMSYDEKNEWNVFAVTAPVLRRDIVISKYMLMGIFVLVTALLSFVTCAITGNDIKISAFMAMAIIPIGMLLNGMIIPLAFKFGVEKSRFIYLCIIIVFIIVMFGLQNIMIFEKIMPGMAGGKPLGAAVIVALLWGSAAVVTVLSILISVKIFNKKEL